MKLQFAQSVSRDDLNIIRRCDIRLAIEFRTNIAGPHYFLLALIAYLYLPLVWIRSIQLRELLVYNTFRVQLERGTPDVVVLLSTQYWSLAHGTLNAHASVIPLEEANVHVVSIHRLKAKIVFQSVGHYVVWFLRLFSLLMTATSCEPCALRVPVTSTCMLDCSYKDDELAALV